ncbi:hypothetical protein XM38_033050 [Halomicronema hongdechloris C2206]|uniref:Uncharacterized protein n=1 Tax=Halomicronema hongdechloris C2206 TaxID=1641165 RepID=A0A1Z3HPV9_9CYAN|nr:hypothetical protein XM38_033050 [Halomicronema hongdechloris C2206]
MPLEALHLFKSNASLGQDRDERQTPYRLNPLQKSVPNPQQKHH